MVAHNDMQAIATIDRLERRASRCRTMFPWSAFDDIPLASHSRVQLTTVRSDAVEMSRRAVDLVIKAARANRTVSHREFLDVQLVVRATTREATQMSGVRYEGIEKRFEAFTALQALNLDIPDRTFLALLGPSGCGQDHRPADPRRVWRRPPPQGHHRRPRCDSFCSPATATSPWCSSPMRSTRI